MRWQKDAATLPFDVDLRKVLVENWKRLKSKVWRNALVIFSRNSYDFFQNLFVASFKRLMFLIDRKKEARSFDSKKVRPFQRPLEHLCASRYIVDFPIFHFACSARSCHAQSARMIHSRRARKMNQYESNVSRWIIPKRKGVKPPWHLSASGKLLSTFPSVFPYFPRAVDPFFTRSTRVSPRFVNVNIVSVARFVFQTRSLAIERLDVRKRKRSRSFETTRNRCTVSRLDACPLQSRCTVHRETIPPAWN